jgi:two-component system OmpR family response regulator
MYARITSLLRRYSKSENNKLVTPKSDFELKGDTIYFKGEALSLTPAEFEVLSLLVKHQGITQSREQIINTSRTMSMDSQGKSLDVIISKIRTKLGDNKRIQAVRGVGYKLV